MREYKETRETIPLRSIRHRQRILSQLTPKMKTKTKAMAKVTAKAKVKAKAKVRTLALAKKMVIPQQMTPCRVL